jgi:DNA-binding GntR family transcriptional regulator
LRRTSSSRIRVLDLLVRDSRRFRDLDQSEPDLMAARPETSAKSFRLARALTCFRLLSTATSTEYCRTHDMSDAFALNKQRRSGRGTIDAGRRRGAPDGGEHDARRRGGEGRESDERPPNRTDAAYEAIERSIVLGELKPGGFLSEPDLIRRTGFGRTPVREALQRLAGTHLVTIVPRRGAFVSQLDALAQLPLIEMRRELDPVVAAAAAGRADVASRQRMTALVAPLRAALATGDNATVVEVDATFKRLVLAACGNPFLARALAPVYAAARRFYFAIAVQPSPAVTARHVALIEAVAAGDGRKAAAAATAFLAEIERLTRRSIGVHAA